MESSENKQAGDVRMEQVARDMQEIAKHVIACCQSTGVGISAELIRIAKGGERERQGNTRKA